MLSTDDVDQLSLHYKNLFVLEAEICLPLKMFSPVEIKRWD